VRSNKILFPPWVIGHVALDRITTTFDSARGLRCTQLALTAAREESGMELDDGLAHATALEEAVRALGRYLCRRGTGTSLNRLFTQADGTSTGGLGP
jgi:hypothetical protein